MNASKTPLFWINFLSFVGLQGILLPQVFDTGLTDWRWWVSLVLLTLVDISAREHARRELIEDLRKSLNGE